jgi:hypothetical protein
MTPAKKQGAPPKPIKRDVPVQFYTTEEISAALCARADHCGVTLSTYVERHMKRLVIDDLDL